MKNPQGHTIWYELLTSDTEAAKAFYRSVVGWTVSAPLHMPDYEVLWAGENDGVGGMMKIPAGAEGEGMRPLWLGYIGVDDVDATAQAIEAAGGTIHMPPQDIPNVGRFAFVADPQGAPFYIMRGDSPEPSRSFDQSRERHGVWSELSTTDQDAAIGFYGPLFGWETAGSMPMGPLGDYTFLKAGETGFGAMMNKSVPDMPTVWTYYFFLNDLDAAIERIKAGGGEIVQEPTEIPGGSFSMVGRDPQGAVFGLVGSR